MTGRVLFILLLIFLGTVSVAGPASAASMDVSPNSIDPGDTVYISYSGLSNGSSFSLLIKGKLDVSPNSKYRMEIKSFVIPISLSNGMISANADNSEQVSLNYEDPSDGNIKSITNLGNTEYICSITESQGISAKTYDNMWIEGVASDGNLVNIELSFIGKKTGPDSGTISFVLDGMDQATLNIVCMADGSVVVNEPIYIGGGSVNTPTATSSTSSSGGGGGAGGGGAAYSDSFVSGETVVDTSGTGSGVQSPGDESFTVSGESTTSVDGDFIYAGSGASDAIIMYDSPGSVPPGWTLEGQSYALISGGTGIDGEIYFKIPEIYLSTGETGSLFIAEFSNGQWTKLQSEISGSVISANISEEGTFALMSGGEEATGVSEQSSQTEGVDAGIVLLICIIIIISVVAIILKLKK